MMAAPYHANNQWEQHMEAQGTNPYKPPEAQVADAASDASGEKLDLKQMLFSFEGRISRKPFWLYGIAAAIVFGILYMIGKRMGTIGMVITLPVNIAYLWVALALHVKRWHDRDKSGWWVLMSFLPVIGTIWVFVECGCLRGTAGGNNYGGDPTDLY
jgi:uncharacterized membrane protein YhaH (DUF805 family)